MNGQYPRFKNSYFYEELTEHFLLTTAELEFVRSCSGNANRQGIAILLKGLEYLGYFPENLQQVPPSIRSFVGKQLGLLTDLTNQYPWESSTRERHLAQIREVTGWRSMTSQDKQELDSGYGRKGPSRLPAGRNCWTVPVSGFSNCGSSCRRKQNSSVS